MGIIALVLFFEFDFLIFVVIKIGRLVFSRI